MQLDHLVRSVVPLPFRKSLAGLLSRQTWLSERHWWSQQLLRDLADADPNAYHRFLWSHHLGYARTYEVQQRFTGPAIHPTRRLLFFDLAHGLADLGVEPDAVESVFEVGCSLGYNLGYLERHLFRGARLLEGCDIDEYAVAQGADYLARHGSRVHLVAGDMSDLDAMLGGRAFDVTLCAGVLMYLARADAERVVASILRHTRIAAVFAGLAHPQRDNATLPESVRRPSDGSFVHNVDRMVVRAGGRIVRRRWAGARQVHGNTVYFVIAAPACSTTGSPESRERPLPLAS
jgi:SAM-dependent methyltransferase